jgi:predicted short-subunit dehydrogenase-like oxidoreductase (DUF2520 family)
LTRTDAAALWIVGPGRAGLSVGALLRDRAGVPLHFGGRRAARPSHPLFRDPTVGYSPLDDPPTAPRGVVIAVPDDAVTLVAERLAALRLAPLPVLHLSGALGDDALAPMRRAGHATGALHPLVALTGADTGARALVGAWFAIEAQGAAETFARWIVEVADGRCLSVGPGGKPLYHAAAVLASNAVVALLDAAESMMADAGVARGDAREALCRLAAGAVRDVARVGPAAALTGPVARGDVTTVARHLDRLSGPELRLYSVLGRRALELARSRGLDPATAHRLDQLLGEHL